MKTAALAFVGLVLFAQEPAKQLMIKDPPLACTIKPDGTLSITGDPVACAGMLKDQVAQLQQQMAQKDQQIAAMSAQLTASGKMFSACFQSLAEAEQRAAAKK